LSVGTVLPFEGSTDEIFKHLLGITKLDKGKNQCNKKKKQEHRI
jgi:hypothetical protein